MHIGNAKHPHIWPGIGIMVVQVLAAQVPPIYCLPCRNCGLDTPEKQG